MFQFLKSDPSKKLLKEYEALQTKAFQAQRDGDIREYSALIAKAETIYEKIERLKINADK